MLTGVLLTCYNLMYYSSRHITMDNFAQDSTATCSLGQFAVSLPVQFARQALHLLLLALSKI